MKNKVLFFGIALLMISCSKDEGDHDIVKVAENEEEVTNETNLAPRDFNILIDEIQFDSAIISWTKPIDPENNPVSFKILLNDSIVSENLTVLRFKLGKLSELTDYSGKIIAIDSFNNETEKTFSFTTLKYYLQFLKYFEFEDFNSPSNDGVARSMVKNSEGNYIIVGTFWKLDKARSQLFALKVDSLGNELWKRFYDYEIHSGLEMKVSNSLDNGILIANRHVVLKIDNEGNEVWHSIVDSYIDNSYSFLMTSGEMKSIKSDKEGNIYAIGTRKSLEIDVGNEGVVTKFDPFGNILWEKVYHFAFTHNDFDDFVINDNNELIILGTTDTSGWTMEELLKQNSSDMEIDYWVLKLNSDGQILWESTYGDFRHDFARQIIETKDGNLVFVGHNPAGGANGSNGNIYKIDANGAMIWNTETDISTTNSIAETADGKFISTGGIGTYVPYFVINQLDAMGNLIWENRYNEELSNIVGQSILADEDGGYRILASIRVQPQILLFKTDADGGYDYSPK